MKKRILLTALPLLLALPFAAQAADGAKKKDAFASADVDGNGKVTRSEYVVAMKGKLDESAAKAKFTELDKDKNGSLSREELDTRNGEKKARKKKDST